MLRYASPLGLFGSVVSSKTNPNGGGIGMERYKKGGSSPPTLYGVSCPTTALCVAVGADGEIATTTKPTSTSPVWTTVDADGTNQLNGVSCPTTTLCVAVGGGDVVTSTNPTEGPWRVTKPTMPEAALLTVSCAPNTTRCVASGDGSARSGSIWQF